MISNFVGNKCDLKEKRVISFEEGALYAKSNGAFFLETSAKTGFNIEKLFLGISRYLLPPT